MSSITSCFQREGQNPRGVSSNGKMKPGSCVTDVCFSPSEKYVQFKYQFIQFSFFVEYTHKLQKKGSPHHLWLYNPCIWHNDILLYLNNFFPFFFWLCHVTNKILVFLTRDGVHAPTLGAWSLNHWTYSEAPVIFFSLLIKKNFFILGCAGSSFRHRGSSSWRVGLSSCSTWA